MKNALILHGTDSTSESNWLPWLKAGLEKKGWKVWAPDLPEAKEPDIERYNKFLLSHPWEFNQDSVIVGHSSGAVATLGLLQALPLGTKVKEVILVGVFNEDMTTHLMQRLFRKPYTPRILGKRIFMWLKVASGIYSFKGLFGKPFDFEKIQSRAEKFTFIHSNNDPYCPLEGAKYLAEKLGGTLTVLPGQWHFSVGTAGEKYRQFPYLLQHIENL